MFSGHSVIFWGAPPPNRIFEARIDQGLHRKSVNGH